jgi:dTDP-4-dehydrorhamnose reductase
LKTILLLGSTGQVGSELRRAAQALGDVVIASRAEADLDVPGSIVGVVERSRPDIIINAAAYTAVDAAEADEERAFRINATTPGLLAEEARRRDVWLVHYSTDYVFDGTAGPYRETTATNPLNAYGRSKAAGEEAIRRSGCRHLILRTSWVYGRMGKNFVNTILRLARERDELRIVSDQIGAPTWSRRIALTTIAILADLDLRAQVSDVVGTYNLTNNGSTNWYEFAKLIVEHTSDSRALTPRIQAIRSDEYPTLATRPKDSRLDCGKIVRTFGVTLPHWRDDVVSCLDEMRRQ